MPDWTIVIVRQLRGMGPDNLAFLHKFPDSWTAADLGDFCFDRPEAAPLVGTMACLWHGAVSKHSQRLDEAALLALLQSEETYRNLDAITRGLRVTPTPACWLDALAPPREETTERTRKRKRAGKEVSRAGTRRRVPHRPAKQATTTRAGARRGLPHRSAKPPKLAESPTSREKKYPPGWRQIGG